MTPVCRSLAAAACTLWLSAVAFGQPSHAASAVSFGPFSNPYGRSFQWLANPQVQEELKLTDDQWDKIKQAQEEMSKKMRDVYRSKDINERDPRKREQAYREKNSGFERRSRRQGTGDPEQGTGGTSEADHPANADGLGQSGKSSACCWTRTLARSSA